MSPGSHPLGHLPSLPTKAKPIRTAMAHLQLQKHSVAQRTETAVHVVQEVLELGVALVLKQKGCFPDDFFSHHTLGSIKSARFDEGWLNNSGGGGDFSQSDEERSDASTVQDDGDQDEFPSNKSESVPVAVGEKRCRPTSTNRPTSRPAGRPPSAGTMPSQPVGTMSSLVVGAKTQSVISPLPPPSMLPSMTAADGNGTQLRAGRHTNSTATDAATTTTQNDANDKMRSEALILLQWIRDGAVEALRRNMLSRVVLGVCVPGASSSSTSGGQRDRLVESFAFDISRDVDMLRKRNIDQSMVSHAVEAMLRNIHGYTSHSLPSAAAAATDPTTRGSMPIHTMPFSSMQELHESICSSRSTHHAAIPKDRYFTFRVEFSRPVSMQKIPPALDTKSSSFGELCNFGSVLSGSDAIPITRWEPTIDRSAMMQRSAPCRLGHVDTKNLAGFGVQMVAFCEEADEEEKEKELCDDEHSMVDSVRVGLKKESPSPLLQKDEGIALAYPHNEVVAMACTIIDARVTAKDGKQFKVRFDSGLVGQQKQWIGESMLVSKGSADISGQKRKGGSGRKAIMASRPKREGQVRPLKKARFKYSYIREPIIVSFC